MTLLHRALAVTTEANDETRRVCVVCSTEGVDRYGDVVVQAGLDLTHFRALKTVLWNHDQDEPIARCVEIDLVGDHIEAVVEFPAAGVNPKSDQIFGLIKAGVVNAVSIGFGVKAATPIDKAHPKAGSTIEQSELWELSFVSVPANPGAVILERRAPARRAAPGSTTMTVKPKTKSLYEVAYLADLLRQLGYIEDAVEWEAEYEGDGSEVPAKLAAVMAALGQVLIDMTVEEVAEMIRVETGEASTKAAGAVFAKRMVEVRSWHLAPSVKAVVETKRSLPADVVARIRAEADAFAADPARKSIVLPEGVTLGLVGMTKGGPIGVMPVTPMTRAGKAFSTKNADAIRAACKSIGDACAGLLSMVDGEADDDADEATDDDPATEAKSAQPDPVQARRRRAARALVLAG